MLHFSEDEKHFSLQTFLKPGPLVFFLMTSKGLHLHLLRNVFIKLNCIKFTYFSVYIMGLLKIRNIWLYLCFKIDHLAENIYFYLRMCAHLLVSPHMWALTYLCEPMFYINRNILYSIYYVLVMFFLVTHSMCFFYINKCTGLLNTYLEL